MPFCYIWVDQAHLVCRCIWATTSYATCLASSGKSGKRRRTPRRVPHPPRRRCRRRGLRASRARAITGPRGAGMTIVIGVNGIVVMIDTRPHAMSRCLPCCHLDATDMCCFFPAVTAAETGNVREVPVGARGGTDSCSRWYGMYILLFGCKHGLA